MSLAEKRRRVGVVTVGSAPRFGAISRDCWGNAGPRWWGEAMRSREAAVLGRSRSRQHLPGVSGNGRRVPYPAM